MNDLSHTPSLAIADDGEVSPSLFGLLDPAWLASVPAPSDLQAGALWRAGMLDHTERITHCGSAEIDMATGDALVSPGLIRLSGRADWPERTSLRALLEWIPADEHRFVLSIWESAIDGEAFDFRHRLLRPDGERREVVQHGVVQRGADGRRTGFVSMQDITERHQDEMRIQELASTDPVTHLPNRHQLLETIEAEIESMAWDDRGIAVFSLQVEPIDYLQHAMGYASADALARAVAERLRTLLPEAGSDELGPDLSAFTARIGSAEFAVVLRAPQESLEAVAQAQAQRIMRALAQPEKLGLLELVPGGHVGIVLFPHPGVSRGELLEAAQMARQDAQASVEHLSVYNAQTRERAMRRLALEAGLRHALDRGELGLSYRAQVQASSGLVVAAEARLCWRSAEFGDVPADVFIPLAEATGLIVSFGDWVRQQVCHLLQERKRRGARPVRLFVLLSPIELQQVDIVERIQAAMLAHEVDPAWFGVEITERALVSNTDEVARKLAALRAIGIEIALGNFGTGESNIALLRSMPIQTLKVHHSFVPEVTDAPEKTALLRAIIELSHSMKTQVVAQGADSAGALSLLLSNGCDRIQGEAVGGAMDDAAMTTLDASVVRLPEHLIRREVRRKTLLLVDDDPSILSSLRRLFRADGYQILTADGGAQGLQKMAETPVDVVLSDQRMPGMTGVEFLRRAKSLYPHTVRIVLSGYTELQSITDAVNEGAIYRFLTKPWDDALLRQHVREAFEHKGLSDENERLSQEVQDANRELALVNDRLAGVLDRQTQQISVETLRSEAARHMLEQLPVPALGLDADGVVVMANGDANRLLGENLPLLGEPLSEVLGVDGREDLDGRRIELAARHFAVRERRLGDIAAQGRLLVLIEEPRA